MALRAQFKIDPRTPEFAKLRSVCEPGNPWRCLIATCAAARAAADAHGSAAGASGRACDGERAATGAVGGGVVRGVGARGTAAGAGHVRRAHRMSLRVFAYGGGWQSNAALVLAAQGKLDYRTFLFCNVGDDSEDPDTLAYVHDHAMPYAAAHDIDLHELQRIKRDGSVETIFGRLTKPGSRSLPIPARMPNGAPFARSCTSDFKIRVIGKWVKQHGATAANPATVAIGISLDEIERANTGRQEPYERLEYPLLDLRIRRSDCPKIIASAGLPMPPKSACWFCPLHRESAWINMRRERPGLFAAACGLENIVNQRRQEQGKFPVFLSRFGRPLGDAIWDADVLDLDVGEGEGQCDSGYCFT